MSEIPGRVLFLIDSLVSGGAQRQVLLVVEGLLASGHDVWLAYYQPRDDFFNQAPPAVRHRIRRIVLQGPPANPVAMARVRSFIVDLRPEVVISFLRGPSVITRLILASGVRFTWVASERDTHLDSQGVLRKLAYIHALGSAHRVVPNSEAAAAELRAAGIPSERIRVIRNAVRVPDPLPPVERSCSTVRFLMVGRLCAAKNPLLVLRALRGVAGNWHLDHVGRHDEDPALLTAFKNAIHENGLTGRVTLHGARSDIPERMATATLLLLPSLHEGFPNVVLEAWMSGLPVVVSDQGDLPTIVDHGRRGFVVKIDDEQPLREVLRAVTSEPDLGWPVARRAREHAIATYSIPAVCAQWAEILPSGGG